MQNDRPLFIVGMPRSGTKLIRDLLNSHSRIAIPESESHFIPYFLRKYHNPPELGSSDSVNAFLKDLTQTPFYLNSVRDGIPFDTQRLREEIASNSWSRIFRFILVSAAPDTNRTATIWGDKTPGYIRHLQLLSGIFPHARFIHIVRDPRDYARSVHRAWGKSPLRAAAIWQRTLDDARRQQTQLSNPFLLIRYEELVQQPSRVLEEVLGFLDLESEPDFGKLRKPSENLGDAAGSKEIVSDNVGKFASYFSARQLCDLERICARGMATLGYQSERCTSPISPSIVIRQLWRLNDAYSSLAFHIREKGFSQGIRYFFLLHKKSSWRDA